MMNQNPWLRIPLSDYEGHMTLSEVAQAGLLADVLESQLRAYSPRSVAVLGCAGGNGFDRIDPAVTGRVVGVDLNPDYVAAASARHQRRLPGLELIVGDLATDNVAFHPVDLIYAALILEHVDPQAVMRRVPPLLAHDGRLCVVLQLPNRSIPDITPSPYTSLGQLSTVMRTVSPALLCGLAADEGFHVVEDDVAKLASGKEFQVLVFERGDRP